MKKKTIKFKLRMLKYLFFVPILLLSYCQSNFEDFSVSSENKLTKDAKVLSLMKAAVKSDLNKTSSKIEGTEEDNQCTHFSYPMTFEVYSGDDPTPVTTEINSDEELIAFIDTLNTSNQFYIFFPITLLDTDGNKTVINDLVELEGTLQMAVDACAGFNDDGSDDGSGSGSDDGSVSGSYDGSGSGSDDGSGSGSDDGSSGSVDSTSGGSNDGSDSASDDSTNAGSDDGNATSNDSSDNDNHNEFEYCQNNNKKVYICHNGHTICVSVNAIWGHMAHHENDYMGSCDE